MTGRSNHVKSSGIKSEILTKVKGKKTGAPAGLLVVLPGFMTAPSIEVGKVQSGLNIREWLWLFFTAAGLLAVYLSPLREHLTHVDELRDEINALGHFGPLAYIGMLVVLTSVGFPRLILFPLGGLVFGFLWGLLWSMAGTIGGAYIAFLYARKVGRGIVEKKWPRLHDFAGVLEGRSFLTVALLRQLPTPGHMTNLFLGISPVRHRAFIFGTLLGCIPSALPAIMIGSSAAQATTQGRLGYVAGSVACLFALWLAGGFFLRYSPNTRALRQIISRGNIDA